MARKKKEPTEVAKYDRALLEKNEFQPIKEVDGVMILVNTYGNFVADAFGTKVNAPTLEKAEEKVHRAFMRQQQKKRAKIGKPCYIYNPERGIRSGGMFVKRGFFRGVHAGNGDVQYRFPDGSKGTSEYAVIFTVEDERVPTLVEALKERQRLEKLVDEQRAIINEITEAQQKVMYADVRTRSYSSKPYISNDPDAAFQATRSIVMNVWGVDPWPEEATDG